MDMANNIRLPHPQPVDVGLLGVGPYDVLLGRSPKVYSAPGNQVFRDIISDHLDHYHKNATRSEKSSLVLHILRTIHATGGRFKRISEEGKWVEVPIEVAKEKICHALRDARLLSNRTTLTAMEVTRHTRKSRKGENLILERSALCHHEERSSGGVEFFNAKQCLQQRSMSVQGVQSLGSTAIDSVISQELILDCQIQSLLRLRRAILNQQLCGIDILPNEQSCLESFYQRPPTVANTDCRPYAEQFPAPLVLSHSQRPFLLRSVDQNALLHCGENHCPSDREPESSTEIVNKLSDLSPTMWQHVQPKDDTSNEQSSPNLIHQDHQPVLVSPTRRISSPKLLDQVAPWNALVPQALKARNVDPMLSSTTEVHHDYGDCFDDDDADDDESLLQNDTQSSADRTSETLKRALDICIDVDFSH